MNKKDEKHLLIIGASTIFIIAFSLGVHSVGQIVGDYFGGPALTDIDLKLLLFILDELFGHAFFVFMPIIFWVFMSLEHNRNLVSLSSLEKKILNSMAIIGGLFWAISGLEGGSMYLLVIPLSLCIAWNKVKKIGLRKIIKYPLSKYYLISLIIMIIVALIWISVFGLFGQPEAMGLHLFDF